MTMPKSILFPVDFSDRSSAVWPAVAAMAQQLRVPVTLFHVVNVGTPHAAAVLSSHLASICTQDRKRLEQFPTPGLEGLTSSCDVVQGPPAQCIVERAAQMAAPMIMLPTRGHTRFRQLLLGSVTSAVLHDAPGPVWTEAHSENGWAHAAGVRRSMVCAVDLGPRTPALLEAAAAFSQKFGVPLHVVHSVPGIDPRFPSALANRAHALLVEAAREVFPGQCRDAGVSFPLEIAHDCGLTDGIVNAVVRHDADLLLIGRGVIQGPLGRLRTNAHELIRRSPCPVLSI